MKLKVKKEEAGQRLDKFLTAKLKNKTRSQIQKIIKSGGVFLDQKARDAHFKVEQNNLIELTLAAEPTKKDALKARTKQDQGLKRKIKIIADTVEFIVLSKPAGLVVHGASHISDFSLVDFLLARYPQIKKIKDDQTSGLNNNNRPGIVHRLDKDASGLMVVAKTQASYDNLKRQFQQRTVEKRYQVLVHGAIAKDYDDIKFFIRRSSAGNKQAAIPEAEGGSDQDAREALTYFEVIKHFINYTLLKVSIKTGRKHQVRVHLHAYGHPVVGDPLYNTKKTRELDQKHGLGRIFLHAEILSFRDLAGERQSFAEDLPGELQDFLLKIK